MSPRVACRDVTAFLAARPARAVGGEVVRRLADHVEECERCARRAGMQADAAWGLPRPRSRAADGCG